MRIAFVAKNEALVPEVYSAFTKAGHTIENPPEVIVVIGGDGTLLRAEADYPGVPKALLKDSAVGYLYRDHTPEQLAAALAGGEYTIEERVALEATAHHVKYRAANDVIIRNKFLTHAIRFTLELNGERCNGEYIGDGLVVATPTGSTAYYHSITKESFERGIGVAFNNLHNTAEAGECMSQLPEESELLVTITRGPADLGVDNSLHIEALQAGDEVRVRRSDVPVRIVRF